MDSQNIFTGITVISWLTLLITGWMSFGVPNVDEINKNTIVVWLMQYYSDDVVFANSFDIYYILFYMIIIFTLILASAAFLVYVYHLFINKNENVINAMLGNISKFHFVPLFCISALFIIGETLELRDFDTTEDMFFLYFGIFFNIKKVHSAFNLIFDIIGLGSLIFISLNTKISEPIYATFTINKGAYSCFIALLVYDFFYVLTLTGFIDKIEDESDDIDKWLKNCGYASSILIGVINIGLSIFLKDIIIGIINLLMYIGMITTFFKLDKKLFVNSIRKGIDLDIVDEVYDGKGIGIIQIIMMVFSLVSIAFLFIQTKPFNPQQ